MSYVVDDCVYGNNSQSGVCEANPGSPNLLLLL